MNKRIIRIVCICVSIFFSFELMNSQIASSDSYFIDSEEFKSGLPYVIEKEPIEMEERSNADIHIRHANPNATYTAVSSDKNIGVLANASLSIPDKDFVTFSFRAKKRGNFSVSVRETVGGQTTELGNVEVIVTKSSEPSDKNLKKSDKKIKKFLKKGVVLDVIDLSGATTVRLEIKSIKSLKKTKKKVSAVIELDHKVTANEYKAYKESFSWYQVEFSDGNYGLIVMHGKLKKGSKKVVLSTDTMVDRAKKGKSYYVTGLDVSKNTPYIIGKKCR